MQFKIVEVDAGLCRVELSGRLDAAGAEMLEAPLSAQFAALRRAVVIDLSEVPFVGSLGIRVLISASRLLQRHGHKVAIYGANAMVLDVLHTVSLDQLIPIAADEASARALVGA